MKTSRQQNHKLKQMHMLMHILHSAQITKIPVMVLLFFLVYGSVAFLYYHLHHCMYR